MTKKQLRRLGVLPYEVTPISRSSTWIPFVRRPLPSIEFDLETNIVEERTRRLRGGWTTENAETVFRQEYQGQFWNNLATVQPLDHITLDFVVTQGREDDNRV